LKVYGQLERAQAELLASDPTGAGLINGRVWFNTVSTKLNFYDGAVRSIVSENGTQTLTNKTLSGNIAANLSPDGVETLTLPVATDTLAALDLAQTLQNKSLPTINFPHQTTPATPAAGNSKLYVKSDKKAYLLDEEGNEIAIGTGGGGLDIYHIEDFSVNNAADMTTGKNATFLGGGTISGTLSDFVDSEGNRQLRYTQVAGSLNDYFAAPAFPVPVKARGNKTGVKFVYTYTGNDVDVKPEIYDVTNGASLVLDTVLVKATSSYKTFEIYIDVPSTCAEMRLGFQTKVENIGAVLTVDDFQFNADALAPSEVYASSDWEEYTPVIEGLGTVTNLQANYRRDGGDLIVRGWANAGTPTAVALTISLPTGLEIDPDRLPAKSNKRNRVGEITRIEAGQRHYGQGGIAHTETPGSTTKVYYSTLPSFDFEFTTNVGTDFATGDGIAWEFRVPIAGWSNVERGVSVRGFENVDNENVFGAKIANNGTASVVSESTSFIQSVSRSSAGVVSVAFKTGIFTAVPSVTLITNQSLVVDHHRIQNLSTSGFTVVTQNSSLSDTDLDFDFHVLRQGVDFIKDHERTVVLPNGLQNPVAYFKDVQPSAVAPSTTLSSGTFVTTGLNIQEGGSSFANLSSSQIQLQPGEYEIDVVQPVYKNDSSFAVFSWRNKWRNVTDGVDVILGGMSQMRNSGNVGGDIKHDHLPLKGIFTITETKTFELQVYVSNSSSQVGVQLGLGIDEVYTQIKITKRS